MTVLSADGSGACAGHFSGCATPCKPRCPAPFPRRASPSIRHGSPSSFNTWGARASSGGGPVEANQRGEGHSSMHAARGLALDSSNACQPATSAPCAPRAWRACSCHYRMQTPDTPPQRAASTSCWRLAPACPCSSSPPPPLALASRMSRCRAELLLCFAVVVMCRAVRFCVSQLNLKTQTLNSRHT